MRSSMLEHICKTIPCPSFDENDPWSVITTNYTYNETPSTPTFFTLISVFAALNAISLQRENSVDAKRCLSPTSTSWERREEGEEESNVKESYAEMDGNACSGSSVRKVDWMMLEKHFPSNPDHIPTSLITARPTQQLVAHTTPHTGM